MMVGRSRGLSISAITVCAIGSKPPPPTPCSARAAIRSRSKAPCAQATEPSDEERDRRQHDHAAAVNVGELAEQRRRRGGREQIGGHHPGQIVDAAEAFADRRQRRCDNGLLQRRQKHRQHDAEEDRADLGVTDACGRGRLRLADGVGHGRRFGRCAASRAHLGESVGGNTRLIVRCNFAGHYAEGFGPAST